MSKLPKKGQVAPANLIALGSKNKTRPTTNTLIGAKRPKIDELSPDSLISTLENSRSDSTTSENLIINYLNQVKSNLIISSKNGKLIPSQGIVIFMVNKKFPHLFSRPAVIDCMSNILSYTGKESSSTISSTFKPQTSTSGNSAASKLKQLHIILCVNIYGCLRDSLKWPISLVKAYLDDSFGERNWVDLPECNLLVQNIETAFPTTGIDVKSFYPQTQTEFLTGIFDACKGIIDVSNVNDCLNSVLTNYDGKYYEKRYEHSKTAIDNLVATYLKDILERRFMMDNQARSVIRTLSSLGGIPEVRGAVITKIDTWLSQSKQQLATLNMLSIMASSCFIEISKSPNDVNFCAHLMLKVKYKLIKPNVQTSLLECLRKVLDMHSGNLKHLMSIYMNNELFGTQSINFPTISQSTSINKTSPFSITFPAVFYKHPTDCVKILAEIIHEYIIKFPNDIKPIRALIRDICRCLRTAHFNTNNVYSPLFTANGSLPESLEFFDLAQLLLTYDKNSTNSNDQNSFLGRLSTDSGFRKTYVENMIFLITDLQLLSVIKPSVKESLKAKYDKDRKSLDIESLRSHYTMVRQIRTLACKWIKSIYSFLDNQISTEQMTNYLKQILFLNITRNSDFHYIIDDLYGISEAWNTEIDKGCLVKGLTEIPLSEKLIQTLLSLGFERTLCFRPVDIVEMLSELIIRASASSCPGIVAMQITKGESIINNMYACCSYDISSNSSGYVTDGNANLSNDGDTSVPLARTLAYKSTFWKVSQALVIVASHCPETCGRLLWNNYPTVKNLMTIVITNNFGYLHSDRKLAEQEYFLLEKDAKKATELESYFIQQEQSIPSSVTGIGRLTELLMLNLPQGPVRQPSIQVMEGFCFLFRSLKIGDRLSQSRNPDFLLEIVKGSQDDDNSNKQAGSLPCSSTSSKKWIIDLVKKTSEDNVNCLPMLCLTEFIFNDLFERISSGKSIIISTNNLDKNDISLRRIMLKIRDIIQRKYLSENENKGGTMKSEQTGDYNEDIDSRVVISALSLSVFRRLSDNSSFTRRVARECLYMILQPPEAPIICMTDLNDFKNSLIKLRELRMLYQQEGNFAVCDTLRETLKFETDVTVLDCYLEFFSDLSTRTNGISKIWLEGVVERLAFLMLDRPLMMEALRDKDEVRSGRLISEIFLSFLEYSGSVDSDEVKKSELGLMVSVNLKGISNPVTITLPVIQSQILLLTWGIEEGNKSCKSIDSLKDMWIVSLPKEKSKRNKTSSLQPRYSFVEFSVLNNDDEIEVQETEIIPQWLVNSGVRSGCTRLMYSLLNYHVKTNHLLDHVVDSTLLSLASNENYLENYLGYIESLCKTDLPLVEQWLQRQAMNYEVSRMFHIVKRLNKKLKLTIPKYLELLKKFVDLEQTYKKDQDDELIDLTDESNGASVSCSVVPFVGGNRIDMKVIETKENIYPKINWNHVLKGEVDVINEALDIINESNDTERKEAISTFIEMKSDIILTFEQRTRILPLIRILISFANNEERVKIVEFWLSTGPLAKTKLEEMETDSDSLVTIDDVVILGLDRFEELISLQLVFGTEAVGRDFCAGMLLHDHNTTGLSLAAATAARYISTSMTATHTTNKSTSSVLRYKVDPSRVLDFIEACEQHPKIRPAVALDNLKITTEHSPDVVICRRPQEMLDLLYVVLKEAELLQSSGIEHNEVTKCLSARCELLYRCTRHSGVASYRSQIISKFLESIFKSHFLFRKMVFSLYCSFLGHVDRKWTDRLGTIGTDIDCQKMPTVRRLGARVLEGLISSRKDVQDMGAKATRTLASRHPDLFLGLLNRIVALAEGALDASYLDFQRKRSQSLYFGLLHLAELCFPADSKRDSQSISYAISLCRCFLLALARYRDEQHKTMPQLAGRLLQLIERLVQIAEASSNLSALEEIWNELSQELHQLTPAYPQMKFLLFSLAETIDRVRKELLDREQKDDSKGLGKCSFDLRNLKKSFSFGADDDVPSSATLSGSTSRTLASLQHELIVNFRCRHYVQQRQCHRNGRRVIMNTNASSSCSGKYRKKLIRHSEVLDLEDVSRRDPYATGMMLEEIRSLLESHPQQEIRLVAVRILGRYLATFPEQAPHFFRACVTWGLSGNSLQYRTTPFTDIGIKIMAQAGMLAPREVANALPRVIRLIAVGRNGRGLGMREVVEQVEQIVDELSLETFLDADVSSEVVNITMSNTKSSRSNFRYSNYSGDSYVQQTPHYRERRDRDYHSQSSAQDHQQSTHQSSQQQHQNNNRTKREQRKRQFIHNSFTNDVGTPQFISHGTATAAPSLADVADAVQHSMRSSMGNHYHQHGAGAALLPLPPPHTGASGFGAILPPPRNATHGYHQAQSQQLHYQRPPKRMRYNHI